MQLQSGGVTLHTSTQFPVRTECVSATPTPGAEARYTVQLDRNTVYVAVEAGAVNVKSRRELRVSAHKSASVDCASPAQDIVLLGSRLPLKVAAGVGAAAIPAASLAISDPKQDISSESTSHR
jgi:hypothetical protein